MMCIWGYPGITGGAKYFQMRVDWFLFEQSLPRRDVLRLAHWHPVNEVSSCGESINPKLDRHMGIKQWGESGLY